MERVPQQRGRLGERRLRQVSISCENEGALYCCDETHHVDMILGRCRTGRKGHRIEVVLLSAKHIVRKRFSTGSHIVILSSASLDLRAARWSCLLFMVTEKLRAVEKRWTRRTSVVPR